LKQIFARKTRHPAPNLNSNLFLEPGMPLHLLILDRRSEP
jgi:hypothetical protein